MIDRTKEFLKHFEKIMRKKPDAKSQKLVDDLNKISALCAKRSKK